MISSFAGKQTHASVQLRSCTDYFSGGTCGPVVAGRMSEDPNAKILILEAGQDSAEIDNMHMPGA